MVAAIDTMAYKGEVPWHGLGNFIGDDENLTGEQFKERAGLNWAVGLKQLYTADGEKVKANATFRQDNGNILGIVGPRYTPYQNDSLFDWAKPFVDAGECNWHTAGSLQGGEKVWGLLELERDPLEIVVGDDVRKYIMISNSHDGSNAIRVGYTPIRVVCWNTLCAAHYSTASRLMKVRHTKNAVVKVDAIRDIMNHVNADFDATAAKYRYLASKQFTASSLLEYVQKVLDANKPYDELPTRMQNTIQDIVKRSVEGIGQDIPGVAGTFWGAYNGVTEYLNYEYGRNADNRMSSLWFGQNANLNKKALDLALTMAG